MSAAKKCETENVPGWQIYGRVDGVTLVEGDMLVRLKSAVIWARGQLLMRVRALGGGIGVRTSLENDDIPRCRCFSLISSNY
jgi:hypothetical protein